MKNSSGHILNHFFLLFNLSVNACQFFFQKTHWPVKRFFTLLYRSSLMMSPNYKTFQWSNKLDCLSISYTSDLVQYLRSRQESLLSEWSHIFSLEWSDKMWHHTSFSSLLPHGPNGRESTVNRVLDGSIYPIKSSEFLLEFFLLGVQKHNNVYLRLLMPSSGW